MNNNTRNFRYLFILFAFLTLGLTSAFAGVASDEEYADNPVPRDPSTYTEEADWSTLQILANRVKEEPFNLVATVIFLLAVIHTFLAGFFRDLAHKIQHAHEEKIHKEGRTASHKPYHEAKDDVSFRATILHFLGEVEAIFGIWLIPLLGAITYFHGWHAVTGYIDFKVKYTEPMFVVIIMAIASTRPVLRFAEDCMKVVAKFLGGSAAAWWFTILTVGPILGSFITEPAAMTIAAILLGRQFYRLNPSPKFMYATLGLLFVNISVGGTLTHFAAPPVLMVAETWGWGLGFMFINFGWKAVVGILLANAVYFMLFKKDFAQLNAPADEVNGQEKGQWEDRQDPVPFSITLIHLFFLGWTVFNLHHPALFIGGFLFFLAFTMATAHHQNDVSIKGPLLVGFFLAALVTHGALQQWWIGPLLEGLGRFPLFIGATLLTAFNDNAAITFLASQVPALAPEVPGSLILEKAVVAGAVTGGGLTVIANAPNPAGQFILGKFFPGGISPIKLFFGAAIPTFLVGLCLYLIP